MITSSLRFSMFLLLLPLFYFKMISAMSDEGLFIGRNSCMTILAWRSSTSLLHAPEYLTGRYNISEGVFCDIAVRDQSLYQNSRRYRWRNSIINIITFYRLATTIKCAVSSQEIKYPA